MSSFRLALGFLTVIPARPATFEPGSLGGAAVWFPTVGLVIGAVVGGADLLLGRLFPPLLTAGLVVTVWAALTGGLHLDGLADCCDGLLASVSIGRRLEIMRDPQLGAFGGIGMTLFLVLKVLAVAALPSVSMPLDRLLVFCLAAALGRWLILLAARQPAARPGGMAAEFALGLSPPTYVLAALVPLGLILVGGGRAVLAGVLAHLTAIVIIRLARARLGGVTGDVLGLTVELSELTVLLTLAAQVPF